MNILTALRYLGYKPHIFSIKIGLFAVKGIVGLHGCIAHILKIG